MKCKISLFFLISILFNLPVINPVLSSTILDQAYSNFQNEDYQYAKILYSHAKGFYARMGEGSSAYRLSDYKAAIKQYTLALLKANNDPQKNKSLFNLANAYYKDDQFIKAIETYKYLLIYTPKSEETQSNLWSAQSMLIDKIKNNKLYVNKESENYENTQDNENENLLEIDKKITRTEKIGYLRTLIGDRVAEGELNAIADKNKSIDKLVLKAMQIKNYLSAIKKLEFVKDNPESILKSIIIFEEKQNKL